MVSHTMSDLLALPDEEDRMKAKGFVERSGMVILRRACRQRRWRCSLRSRHTVRRSKRLLVGWQDPPAWDSVAGRETAPPGRGNFLVKVGGRPGIPVHVALTAVERSLNDTNKLWHAQSRLGGASVQADSQG